MSGNLFAVVFSGQLVEGATAARVKANFARLFKVELAKVEPMFGGKPVAIKKGLDEATARKYQQVLRQAGAVCRVVGMAAPAQRTGVRPAKAAGNGGAAAVPASLATAARSTNPPPVPATGRPRPDVPVLKATLAEPGVLLKEPERVAPLRVDISRLSMGAVGETLVEAKPVPVLRVDISGLSMAEPGVVLKEPEPVKPLDIDTSRIRLA